MAFIAGPVNSLTDFQLEYDGLLMGAGTNYGVPPTWSVFDMASVKSMDTPRQWAAGSWSGPDYADVLLPEFPIEIWGLDSATFAAAVLAFRRSIAVGKVAPLWVKVPLFDPIGILAKPNRRSIPIDLSWGQVSFATVEFRCPDPTWQSLSRTVTLAPASAAAAGLLMPLFSPAGVLNYGATGIAPNTAAIANAGNAPAWPTVTVSGPTTGFTIVIDGNSVIYSGTVPAGQAVAVDYAAGSATLVPDGVDRTYLLTARQFSPVTSSSTVGFTATGGTAAVTIADMWG